MSLRILALASVAVLAGGWLVGVGQAVSSAPDIDQFIFAPPAVPAAMNVAVGLPTISEQRRAYTPRRRIAMSCSVCEKQTGDAKENCLSNCD
jgi:hypothetical protein